MRCGKKTNKLKTYFSRRLSALQETRFGQNCIAALSDMDAWFTPHGG